MDLQLCYAMHGYALILKFPDVILMFESTRVMVREDEGTLNLTVTKQRAAVIAVTMVISTQPQQAKRELMSRAFCDMYWYYVICTLVWISSE